MLAVLPLMLSSPAGAAPISTPERLVTNPRTLLSPNNPLAHPVPPEDLAVTRGVLDAAWSADGRRVFLTTNLTGRYNIWRVDAGGGWPVQLTRSEDLQEGLVVSPDGASLFYDQDKAGDEMHDLYVVPTAGGEPRNLTHTAEVDEQSPVVSPDGRFLAFSLKRKEDSQFNVALLDLATGKVRTLTTEAEEGRRWQVVAWTRDGRSLIANRQSVAPIECGIWTIDVASGKAAPVAQKPGAQFTAAGVSADGRTIAATSDEGGANARAGLLDRATGHWRWLKPTPWEQSATDVTPDGRTAIVRLNANGRSALSQVDMATGRERPLAMSPGRNETVGVRPFSPDSRRLLVRHAGSDTPAELFIADLRPGGVAPRRVTSLAMASVDPAALAKSEVVTYRSFDGTLVSAVVILPANLKRDGRNPAVVLPHGGPTGQVQDGFTRTAVALASRGYITIAPNFRGSTGYGKAFQDANRMDLGGGDLKDVIAAKRFLVETGYVDPKRVGIAGESYGGFMTLMAISRAPDEFAAAVQSYGIIDWSTMWEKADPLFREYQRGLIGDPVADAAVYKASSPLTYLKQAKAPLLSLQGENDIRVSPGQARQVADVLKAKNSVVETVFYPGEGHGFNKRENQIDAMTRTIDWFDRYLKVESSK